QVGAHCLFRGSGADHDPAEERLQAPAGDAARQPVDGMAAPQSALVPARHQALGRAARYRRRVADYISRALIADALAEWREHLRSAATVSPLRDLAASDASVIEINSAHPSGLAQLFAHRTTLLSTMIQEPGAYRVASHRG